MVAGTLGCVEAWTGLEPRTAPSHWRVDRGAPTLDMGRAPVEGTPARGIHEDVRVGVRRRSARGGGQREPRARATEVVPAWFVSAELYQRQFRRAHPERDLP